MFDPLKETILEYCKRKADELEFRNRSDIVRQAGISHWNLSKILRGVHSPTLSTVQPLFTFFCKHDAAKLKAKQQTTSRKTKTVN